MPDPEQHYLEISIRDRRSEVRKDIEVRSDTPQTPQQAIDMISREIGHLWGDKHTREVETER
jgi:hypothetical protein